MKHFFFTLLPILMAGSGVTNPYTLPEKDQITEITLERTACLGSCPAYKVILRQDGTATYMGKKNVERRGEYKGSVDRYFFSRLANLIQARGFFKLRDSYAKPVSDMPGVIVSVVRGSQQKRVSNYADAGPIELWGIEMAIDAVITRIKWRKVGHVTLSKQDQVTEITLERTRCYGTCPAYKVTLRRDGTAMYLGQAHVERKGTYEGTIDRYYFDRLSKLIQSQGFYELESSYSKPVTDNPGTIVTVTRGNERKRVSNYAGAGPIQLWGIEMAIDAVVEQVRWKKSG